MVSRNGSGMKKRKHEFVFGMEICDNLNLIWRGFMQFIANQIGISILTIYFSFEIGLETHTHANWKLQVKCVYKFTEILLSEWVNIWDEGAAIISMKNGVIYSKMGKIELNNNKKQTYISHDIRCIV